MKKPQTRAGLLNVVSRDPHGDTRLVQVNPQEIGLLRRAGGAGVVNPRTGLLQFYDTGPGTSGGPSGNGAQGGSRSDHSGIGNNSSDHGFGGGGGGGPAPGSPGTPTAKPRAILDNLNQMYDQYSAPKSWLDRIGGFLGLSSMNPTAAQAAADYAKNPTNYPDVHTSWDPVRTGLQAAGFFNPAAAIASSAYGVYSQFGPHPQVDLGALGSGLGGYGYGSNPSSAPNGPSAPGTNTNHDSGYGNSIANAVSQPAQQQQAALAASTGLTGSMPAMGLLTQYQPSQYQQTAPGYGYQAPGYGYLSWGQR